MIKNHLHWPKHIWPVMTPTFWLWSFVLCVWSMGIQIAWKINWMYKHAFVLVPFQIYFKFFLFNHISNEVWEHRDFAKENIKYPFHIKRPYYFKHNGLNCHFLHFTICGTTKKIWCFCNKKMVAFFNKRIFHGIYYSIKFYANCHHSVPPKS